MSKAVKKKRRRLWRTVRKTLGTLFLVSALVVAAIPVDSLQAIGDKSQQIDTGIDDLPSVIPTIQQDDPVYSYVVKYGEIEKVFNFVYVPEDEQRANGGMATNVIITNYQKLGDSPAILEIPEKVDGYRQYSDVAGVTLVAAGKSGNFLFYRNDVTEEYTIEQANSITEAQKGAPDYYKVGSHFYDENGVEKVYVSHEVGDFQPCKRSNILEWQRIENERGLYYYENGTTAPTTYEDYAVANYAKFHKAATDSSYARINGIKVNYISDQYQDTDGRWKRIDSPEKAEKGVFSNVDNITELRFGNSFGGVGNYAFYGCRNLETVTFHGEREDGSLGGLQMIGESAFEGCTNLKKVEIKKCQLNSISSKAFKGCKQLGSEDVVEVPTTVRQIGDSAFEGCVRLARVDLCGDTGNEGSFTASLTAIGKDVFLGCTGLESVTFPEDYEKPIYISCFKDCTALKSIGVRNINLSFISDGDYYSLEDFWIQMGKEEARFYFSGPVDFVLRPDDGSELRKLCRDNGFTFGYTGGINENFQEQHRYELTRRNGAGTETFVANSSNELIEYSNSGQPSLSSAIPSRIGIYDINTLTVGVFKNCCNLRTVTIPATVTTIEKDAFKGCHNLEWVTFPPDDRVSIDSTAFATQSADAHQSGCTGGPSVSGNAPEKKLHFLGTISPDSGSFCYAMGPDGRYSAGGQEDSFIIYCSGEPGNLEVEFNPNLGEEGMSELVRFPSLEDLYTGKYSSYNYEYLDAGYAGAAREAVEAYMATDKEAGNGPSTDQQKYIDSALKIEIPNGVQSIKPGLIKEKDKANYEFLSGNTSYLSKNSLEMTVKAYNLAAIKEGTEDEAAYGGIQDGTGTFAGCTHLKDVNLVETATAPVIEAHAFANCENLETVSIPPNVSDMGRCPFYNCGKLRDINFQNSDYFEFEDAIIYRRGAPGEDGERPKIAIFECLKNRYAKDEEGNYVATDPFIVKVPKTELMKISGEYGVEPEAFRGSNVSEVDLINTEISYLKEGTFADTDKLGTVELPKSLETIENYAFAGSSIHTFKLHGTKTKAQPYAFYAEKSPYKEGGLKRSPNGPNGVNWLCLEDTETYETGHFAQFILGSLDVSVEYTVNFDYYNQAGEHKYIENAQVVTREEDVVYPEDVMERRTSEDGLPQKFDKTWKKTENTEKKTWTFEPNYKTIKWVVTIMDSQERGSETLGTIDVFDGLSAKDGADALLKAKVPEDVYASFDKWSCAGDYNSVKQNLTMVATYVPKGWHKVEYYVMVGSYNNYDFYTSYSAKENEPAQNIPGPTDEKYQIPGYSFVGWIDLPEKVDKPWKIYGDYRPSSGDGTNSSPSSSPSPDPDTTPDPDKSPGPDASPSPSPGPDASPSPSPGPGTSPSPSPSPGPNGGNTGSGNDVARHTLQVRGGSGSGYYAAGEQIIITADEPAKGQQFSSWTVSPASTVVTDKTLAAFILTMPDHDVAVIANYKASPSSGGSNGSSTGTGSSSNTNSNRPNGSTGKVGGTTVVIDKNGLSNTGVVSATVNGSSDSFTLKITESSSAAEAVLRALQAEYGSLDNIRYFPMDISLYDATGNTKITDTTGLSVDITLPLPDSLITYAGNNKVAGVVNDRLDKLTPKFTTINGVACMTFTAEHFSPYVIYVDIVNLSDGTISDSTPTTGDGIHPKWFLSIGLACLSFVMFMIKDNKSSAKKKKVAVKARN